MPHSLLSRTLVLLSGILPALVLAETYLLSRNTLENNSRWLSTKATFEVPPIGAEAFVAEPQALARGRLDLSAFHGFQEVLFKKRLDAALGK